MESPNAETTARVDALAEAVGLSERQLNRRCRAIW
jgi:transcriptional regulator GlxA family with amidase domain